MTTKIHEYGYARHLLEGIEWQHKCGGYETTFKLSSLDDFTCPECGRALAVTLFESGGGYVWWPTTGDGFVKVSEHIELPDQRRKRYQEDDDLGYELSDKLTSTKWLSDLYDEVKGQYSETAAIYLTDILLGELHHRDMEMPPETDTVYTIIDGLGNDDITQDQAVDITRRWLNGSDVSLDDYSNDYDLDQIVDEAIEAEADAVGDFKSGEDAAINTIIGYVMQETQGGADGDVVREKIVERIG